MRPMQRGESGEDKQATFSLKVPAQFKEDLANYRIFRYSRQLVWR